MCQLCYCIALKGKVSNRGFSMTTFLTKIRLSMLGLVVGGILTIVGIVAYATGNATVNLAGFFYGIPLFLGGLALKAAELTPVPFTEPTTPEILKLREDQATATQKQIRQDVTRYRYGQDAHLDESLQKIGLSPTDEERPVLDGLKEMAIDGKYSLILEFYSPLISLEKWQEKQDKITRFFGPDIRVEIESPQAKRVNVSLIKV
jgi:hypothetical protein